MTLRDIITGKFIDDLFDFGSWDNSTMGMGYERKIKAELKVFYSLPSSSKSKTKRS